MFKKIVVGTLIVSSMAYAVSEVNVYTHRHYDADKQLFSQFEAKTGIKVNVVTAKASELLKRLEKEGAKSPADIFITADVARLHLAKERGLLQKANSQYLVDTIPAKLRDNDGQWFALTTRARVIVYNKSKVNASELSTYEDMVNPKWKGRLLVRTGSNIYNTSFIASMIASQGREAAKKWAAGVVKNLARAPKGGDTDQIRAVAAGIGDIAFVNTYYVGRLLNSKKSADVMVGEQVGVFFPNQGAGERGAHINISGIALTKSSDKNRANAIKLMEFLVSPDAQYIFSEANSEFPVNPKVEASKTLKSWGEFKADSLPLYKFGVYNAEAMKIVNEVNWK
jgi:iron(III) transport system substrate-binding protein